MIHVAASPVWRREFRGAQRRWWRQPWLAPLALVVLWATHERTHAAWLGVLVTPEIAPGWRIPLVRPLLALWAVVAICRALTGDRPGHASLAVTALAPRSLALAKTLAPAWPALLALVGLRWVALSEIAFLPDEDFLMALGHLHFSEMVIYGHVALAAIGRPLLLLGAAVASPLLALALAAFASWVAARCRTTLRAVLFTLGSLAALSLAAMALDWVMYTQALSIDSWTGFSPIPSMAPNFQAWAHSMVAVELVYDFAFRLALPLLWLALWWRWTERGFLQVWLGEE